MSTFYQNQTSVSWFSKQKHVVQILTFLNFSLQDNWGFMELIVSCFGEKMHCNGGVVFWLT